MKREIYLAGGCFWGTEHYLQNVKGVIKTEVGYANGNTEHPTYEQVCHKDTGHAEAVRVEYDGDAVTLPFLLSLYYKVVNPTSVNKQGGDRGTQYRTGIYYVERGDREAILQSIAQLQERYPEPIAIEVLPLENYSPAEDEHQKYLDKHPNGYCHIGRDAVENVKHVADPALERGKKSKETLQEMLTPLQFAVTQNGGTEPAFRNEFYDQFQRGIYVDITTGEPLFLSADKFDSGCGWPAFSKPIDRGQVSERVDETHGMRRTEVRSAGGDAHLGHVFPDGPPERGGNRYCINSAALRFVPAEDMEGQGYGAYLPLIERDLTAPRGDSTGEK